MFTHTVSNLGFEGTATCFFTPVLDLAGVWGPRSRLYYYFQRRCNELGTHVRTGWPQPTAIGKQREPEINQMP